MQVDGRVGPLNLNSESVRVHGGRQVLLAPHHTSSDVAVRGDPGCNDLDRDRPEWLDRVDWAWSRIATRTKPKDRHEKTREGLVQKCAHGEPFATKGRGCQGIRLRCSYVARVRVFPPWSLVWRRRYSGSLDYKDGTRRPKNTDEAP